MPYKDPEKKREYQQKWYKENREKEITSAGKRKWKFMAKMKNFVNDKKASEGCCNCPEKEPCCLDYHHTRDDKEIDIAQAIRQGWGKKRLEAEIKKCIVICANCHRKLYAGLLKIE